MSTNQILFNHQTEEDRVPDFTAVVEDESFQLGVLDDVLQLMLVILEDSRGAIIEARELANGRHHPQQGGHVLDYGALQLTHQHFTENYSTK